MKDLNSVILSQYANSSILMQLIKNFNQYIDPSADIDAFYNLIWNVRTAKGYGLDVWGRIVGLNGRTLKIPSSEIRFGFNEATVLSAAPFDQGTFADGDQSLQTFRVLDDSYRIMIMVKALSNISDCSIPSFNTLLSNLFVKRGTCYVIDEGNMSMRYVFEFALTPIEMAIITQSGALPHPCGVQINILEFDTGKFGFSEGGWSTFSDGTFFTGLTNAG